MDSGSSKPHAARQWVDKADLTAYMRCPYAWWNVDQGLVSLEEAIDLPDPGALQGSVLQGRVESFEPPPSEERLRELFTENIKLLGIPVLENPERQIFGSPAGVDADSGALRPISTEAHR